MGEGYEGGFYKKNGGDAEVVFECGCSMGFGDGSIDFFDARGMGTVEVGEIEVE